MDVITKKVLGLWVAHKDKVFFTNNFWQILKIQILAEILYRNGAVCNQELTVEFGLGS